MRPREAEDRAHQRAAGLRPHLVRPGRRAAAKHHRAARGVRRPSEGGAGTRLVRAVQSDAPGVPRSAHRSHRHRAQHDRSQHAYRRSAQAVAVAGHGAAEPAGRVADRPTHELQEKATLLAHQNVEVERKEPAKSNRPARRLEEKAKQLGAHFEVQIRVPGEYVARVAHAAQQPAHSLRSALEEHPDGNLTGRSKPNSPRRFTRPATICSMLINDILDLSKIESGTVVVDVGELRLPRSQRLRRTHRSGTSPKRKKLDFAHRHRSRTCRRSMHTDAKRLQQVIKNLLSNAFKFTQRGPRVARRCAALSRRLEHARTRRSTRELRDRVLASPIPASASPPDKQQIIFEAFQQADGSTSRKYGGTGLGLAISREIARLLGGELRLSSSDGRASAARSRCSCRDVLPMAPPRVQTPACFLRPASCLHRQPAVIPSRHAGAVSTGNTEESTLTRTIAGPGIKGDRVLLVDRERQGRSAACCSWKLARERAVPRPSWRASRRAVASSHSRSGSIPSAITLDLRLPDMDGLGRARSAEARSGGVVTSRCEIFVTRPKPSANALSEVRRDRTSCSGNSPITAESRNQVDSAHRRLSSIA